MKFEIGLLFILLNGAVIFSDEADPYRKLGSSFDICPDSVTPPLTWITWMHGVHIAVDWSGHNVTYYRIFKDHCSLNTTSGCLTLSNVTHEHSGYYTPMINYEWENPTEIKIISPVPKPKVSLDCNDEKTQCNLICEGIITDNHGPVEFSWILADKYRPGNKTLNITQENQERFISCVLENPVSIKQSENLPHPLIRRDGDDSTPGIVGVIVTFLIILIIAVLVLLWFLKRKEKLKADEQKKMGRKEPVDQELMQDTVDDADDDDSGAVDPTVDQKLMEVTVDDADDDDSGADKPRVDNADDSGSDKPTVRQELMKKTGDGDDENDGDDDSGSEPDH